MVVYLGRVGEFKMDLLFEGERRYNMVEITLRDYKRLIEGSQLTTWLEDKGFTYLEVCRIRVKYFIRKMTVILFV